MNDREMIKYLKMYFEQFRDIGYDGYINDQAIEDIDVHLKEE